jgi:hypothetical protein
MEVFVVMDDGPSDKQSISDLYNGKTLPKALQTLPTIASSAQEGRQSTQKNNYHIFLVPAKS